MTKFFNACLHTRVLQEANGKIQVHTRTIPPVSLPILPDREKRDATTLFLSSSQDNVGPKYRRSSAYLRLKIRLPPPPPRVTFYNPLLSQSALPSSADRAFLPRRSFFATFFFPRTRARQEENDKGRRQREREACRLGTFNDSRRESISERRSIAAIPGAAIVRRVKHARGHIFRLAFTRSTRRKFHDRRTLRGSPQNGK